MTLGKANVDKLFSALAAATPAPKSELDYKSPFTLLVAVVLSAQATDVGVNKATPGLFALADTPEKMAKLGEALEALPGVGRKTANVVLNVAFDQPTMAVDTHVFRLANRTGLAPGKNPLEVEKELLKVVPERWQQHAHHWLILHGRHVCKARKPSCPACVIAKICRYGAKEEA